VKEFNNAGCLQYWDTRLCLHSKNVGCINFVLILRLSKMSPKIEFTNNSRKTVPKWHKIYVYFMSFWHSFYTVRVCHVQCRYDIIYFRSAAQRSFANSVARTNNVFYSSGVVACYEVGIKRDHCHSAVLSLWTDALMSIQVVRSYFFRSLNDKQNKNCVKIALK